MTTTTVIRSSGMFVPEGVVTNDRMSLLMDTSDEWIRQRTGIEERRYARKGTSSADLGHEAAKLDVGFGPRYDPAAQAFVAQYEYDAIHTLTARQAGSAAAADAANAAARGPTVHARSYLFWVDAAGAIVRAQIRQP